ncbi:hypoxanthine phosphoribosyltransferase [Micromonospora sediminicola]|uniref:hypoxanthine phosphoribosyltransferase n=1 Tax=Micromonospora sediminicola TaxID=946078 RepID=UPI0037878C11
MDLDHVAADLERVLLTGKEILDRVAELAAEIEYDYQGKDLVVVGVLGGAAPATVDLTRALNRHVEITWIAVSSYGSGVGSSGIIRLLKDIDIDIKGRHVLVVEDVIDTGLTSSWVTSNLQSRGAASIRVCAMFRKPNAPRGSKVAHYVGFEVDDGMVVGYGLDYAGRYRNLEACAILAPQVYQGAPAGAQAAG